MTNTKTLMFEREERVTEGESGRGREMEMERELQLVYPVCLHADVHNYLHACECVKSVYFA